MHGLTIFQHHIVCDVNDIVDRTDAVGAQALTQPLGRGANFDIGDHSCAVSVAEIIRWDFHVQHFVHGACVASLYFRLVVAHLLAECCGSFPGKTNNRVAIGAIIRDLKINDGIIIADHGVDIIAGFAILLDDPNAVFNGIGEIAQRQIQLFQRAKHAVGNLTTQLALGNMNAARQIGIVQSCGNQIAFFYILGAGDDLYRRILSHIDLADPHMVRVLMTLNGNHFADYDILDLGVHALIGFNFLTEDGHGVYKLLVGHMGKIYKFFIDPFSVEFHS